MQHPRKMVVIIIATTGQLADQRHRGSLESFFTCTANYLPSRNVISIEVTKKNKTDVFSQESHESSRDNYHTMC